MLTVLMSAVRHGSRLLARDPVLSFVAVFALTLGIGIPTAMFSILEAISIMEALSSSIAEAMVWVWVEASLVLPAAS